VGDRLNKDENMSDGQFFILIAAMVGCTIALIFGITSR